MTAAGLISSNRKSNVDALADDLNAVTDERLVALAKMGHGAAFDELYRRHAEKMFRTTHRITRNREDAEDALQECFLNAFLHLRSFDGRSRFSTWLTRIAMNAALMRMRKNRASREMPTGERVTIYELGAEHGLADPSPDPEERYARSERDVILRDAIGKLRPGIRKAVEIQLQDCSLSETAEILEISVSALKGRLFHARTELRQGWQLHPTVPSIWTNPEPSSQAVTRVSRPREGRKEKVRSRRLRIQAYRIEAEVQAEGASLKEAQL